MTFLTAKCKWCNQDFRFEKDISQMRVFCGLECMYENRKEETRLRNEMTWEKLKTILHYDPETGDFKWLVYKGREDLKKEFAGTLTPQGYITINVLGKVYRAHILAWFYMKGEWPKDKIDHENCIRNDNRFKNLREATSAENNQNFKSYKRRKSNLPMGVWQKDRDDKFHSKVNHLGIVHYCGTFDTAEEAHQAYLEKKRELHPFCTI